MPPSVGRVHPRHVLRGGCAVAASGHAYSAYALRGDRVFVLFVFPPCFMRHLCHCVGLYAHIHVCIPAHALRGSCVIDAVCVFAYVLRRVMPLPLRWAMRISAVLYEASLPSCRIVCIYTRMHPCLCLAKQSCHCHRVRPCVFPPMPYVAIVSLYSVYSFRAL